MSTKHLTFEVLYRVIWRHSLCLLGQHANLNDGNRIGRPVEEYEVSFSLILYRGTACDRNYAEEKQRHSSWPRTLDRIIAKEDTWTQCPLGRKKKAESKRNATRARFELAINPKVTVLNARAINWASLTDNLAALPRASDCTHRSAGSRRSRRSIYDAFSSLRYF